MDPLDLQSTEPLCYGAYNACLVAGVGSLNFSGYYGRNGYASILPASDRDWAVPIRAFETYKKSSGGSTLIST